jgi:hypothetical protein
LEVWRVKYVVLPVYRNEEDGEWASWQADVRLSMKEAGVVVIESDSDGNDDANGGEASGKDGE